MLDRGTRLGPYEVESALGAGGMGEVYRARDTRLDRTVALKVLSAKLDATPDLRSRFEREARAIAALQHPNICVLHDLGQEGATAFLVMEYLEGETLALRLRRGALPLAEVINIGGQIASALERAHRAGIVHRDLKPANVMLTPGGAKLLDFGLAKATVASGFAQTAAASDAPTLSAMTQAGVVMGTVPYMAPEQLEWREADARSDIYAFGCLLYEMTTGEAAYKGTRALQPPPLNRLVQTCLARNPDERVQSAHDAGLMLTAAGETTALAAGPSKRRRWLWPAITAAAAIVAAAVAWSLHPATRVAQISAEIAPPPGTHFAFQGVHPGPPVISPDGSKILFLASSGNHTSLWLRSLDSPVVRELPGTIGADLPFWSPDSREIGFAQSATEVGVVDTGTLMVLDLAGGAPRELAPVNTFRGGTWAADGTILYAPDSRGDLMQIRTSGGTPQPVLRASANIDSHRFPYFLPDGKHFLYMTVSHADPTRDMICEASLDGRMNRPLVASQTPGIYAEGILLYSDRNTLLAQKLDPATGALGGSPRQVATGIYDDVESWRPGYSVSRTGLLIYASGSAGAQRLAWANRNGTLGPLLPTYSGEAVQVSVAPDGARFALAVDNGIQDIWSQSSTGGTLTRLTFGGPLHSSPVWSPDGRWIAYSDRATVWRIAATGGARQRIGAGPAGTTLFEPAGWSADGKELLCMLVNEHGLNSMMALNVASGALRHVATTPEMNIAELELSPDSRWAGYLAGAPGQPENVYLVPFRGSSGSVWQVTTAGASRFFWVKDGRELDVIDEAGQLLAISVTVNGDAPVLGAPQVVAAKFPEAIASAPDGQRFLVVTYPDDRQSLRVLSDWTRALH